VIGIGGIQTAADALEFILVGASAVQVGTANFRNPRACVEIIEGMEVFMREERLPGIDSFRGKLLL
jgi:dihydroorotate dehydrogenase (NAD+) catalytic subunit